MKSLAVNLGDFTKIKTGKLDANASSEDGEYPFFTCAQQPLRISSYSYDCECVLIAGNGDLNVKYYEGKFDAYQRTYIVEVLPEKQDKLHLRYAYHFLETYLDTLREQSIGGIIKYIKMGNLTDAQIPLPPLDEQKRIAAILDAADALRAKRRQSIAQLDALIQSTFLDLFGDPVTNPMGWPEVEFEKIVESTKLGMVRGSTEFDWKMPVPYVRMDAITNDGQFLPEKVQGTFASEEEIEAYSLRAGDFLLNTRNSKELVGKITVFRGPKGWTFNNNIIRIRFFENVEPDAIAVQFRFSRVQQALENRKAGTTSVFAIYWKDLKTLPVLLPPLPIQQKFATIVESIERQKTAQRDHLTELDALFAALQHRAFRGEL
jgi:type I restriction enzyme S subunit